jgi:hypothetical protein
MSFKAIRTSHPQASKLLHLLAFLNPDGTMLEFLEAGAEALDADLRSMLGDLTEMAMSLLELEKSSIIKFSGHEPIGNSASMSVSSIAEPLSVASH